MEEVWKEYKLGDIGTIVGGATPSTKDPLNYDGNISWITPKDLSNFNGRYIGRGERMITTEGFNSSSCRMLPKGSVLFSSRAPIGYVAIAKNELCTNQGFKSVIPNPKIVDSTFLYYLLVFNKTRIEGLGSGTTFKEVSGQVMKNVSVLLPSLNTQQSIASVLSSIDDKIECNKLINDNLPWALWMTHLILLLFKRKNDNLEQQAQALFKSWFVDFEPFKNGEFVESEMGMIPKNLIVKRVSEIPHTIETGRRPKGGVGEITSGVPSVGAEHVKGLGNYDYSKTKYITEGYAASLKTGKVNGYELLIYKDGGKPGYFIPNYSIFGEGYPFEECFLNEHVFKLDFGDKGYNAFCYFYFWTDYVMNYLNAQGGKAAIPGINRQDIEDILIYSPENEIVKQYGDFVLPLIRQILFNCKESRRLAQLRDTLLPRLMSGELKVNEI